MTARRVSTLVVVLALAGCGSTGPAAPQDPLEGLDLGATLLEETDPDPAYAVLSSYDDDEFAGADRERFLLLWASALFRSGYGWEAFKVIRRFVDEYRFSDYAGAVESLHFSIGEWLIQSDGGFFLVGWDADDGATVLTEFVERYPNSVHAAEGLRLLGDLAFDQELWFDARRRYQEILQSHPNSEWASFAHYKVAITSFLALEGEPYDFDQMHRARNELRDYLATDPERPEFRDEATEAFATVDGWIAQRRQRMAEFYHTIDNDYGEREQWKLLIEDCPEQPLVETARERLARLEQKAIDEALDHKEKSALEPSKKTADDNPTGAGT